MTREFLQNAARSDIAAESSSYKEEEEEEEEEKEEEEGSRGCVHVIPRDRYRVVAHVKTKRYLR